MGDASSDAPIPKAGRCDTTKFYRGLRLVGGITGMVVIALGLWSLFTSALIPQLLINALYQVFFGALMVISELRLQSILVHFRFLTHFLGLGLFYVFVGGLALDSSWYQYIIAIVLLSVGGIYVLLGLACRTMSKQGFAPLEDNPVDQSNSVSSHATASAAQYQPPQPSKEIAINPWDAPLPHSRETNNPTPSSSSFSYSRSQQHQPWDAPAQGGVGAWGAANPNWSIENPLPTETTATATATASSASITVSISPSTAVSALSAANKYVPDHVKRQAAHAAVDHVVNNANPFAANPFE